jgi:hypothetical protein
MEVLSFDSRFPNPRYSGWIGEFREALAQIPMIAPCSPSAATASLLNLDSALTDSSGPRPCGTAVEADAPNLSAQFPGGAVH